MSRRDLIIAALHGRALCDDCLSEVTGIKPRQSVNQCCRIDLAGVVNRSKEKVCSICQNEYKLDKIVNEIA
jgi:hypothetical protein